MNIKELAKEVYNDCGGEGGFNIDTWDYGSDGIESIIKALIQYVREKGERANNGCEHDKEIEIKLEDKMTLRISVIDF